MNAYLKLFFSIIILMLIISCDEKKEEESNPTDPNTTSTPFKNMKVVKRITGLNGGEAVETVDGVLYVGDLTGISVYRITNPENPEFRKKIALTTVYDLYAKRYNEYTFNLFAACGGNGLSIFEINGSSNLDPVFKSFVPGGFYSDVAAEGSRMYVASQLSRGVRVFNISNAFEPKLEYSIDQQANSVGVAINTNMDLVVVDYDGKVKIYDMLYLPSVRSTSQPININSKLLSVSTLFGDDACVGAESGVYFLHTNPSRITTSEVASSLLIGGDVHDSEIIYKESEGKKYAFLAAGNKDLIVVDITDKDKPKIVKELALDGNARDLKIYGNYIFVVGDYDLNIVKMD